MSRQPFPRPGEQLSDPNVSERDASNQASRSASSGARFFRCSDGHVFKLSYWFWWGSSFTVVRLGFAAYMRCPVGKHWALVRWVKEADLTEQERQNVELQPFGFGEGAKLTGPFWVLIGLFSLIMSIVTQSWWLAAVCALWICYWGAVLVQAIRRGGTERRGT